MVDLVILDGLVRGAAIGGFAVTGAALAISGPSTPTRWVGAAFFACASAHAVANCAILQGRLGPIELGIWLLSVMGSGLFWTFAVTLFSDDPDVPPQWFIPPVAVIVLALAGRAVGGEARGVFQFAQSLVAFLLVLHAGFVIWRGWRGDLVEQRRRLRAPVMAAAAAYVLLTAMGDLSAVLGEQPPTLPLGQAVALAALALAGALVLLKPDPALLSGLTALASPSLRIRPDLDVADQAALARLDRAMDEEQIWRREDLSIGALSSHVAIPEHRLRRLINGALGHRNFTAFVNARRIDAAKAALTDPGQARKPVSSVAYELGFGSLGPFNRAFKAVTGLTPSAWRQAGQSPIPESRAET